MHQHRISSSWFKLLIGLFNYSLTGWARFIRLKLAGKEVIVRGFCTQCGACCQGFCLNINCAWLLSRRRLQRELQKHPLYDRFEVDGKNARGNFEFNCSYLTEEGTCKDHENRPSLCKGYPERDLYFMNATLPEDCSYYYEEVTSFARVLKKINKGTMPNRASNHK